MILIGHGVQQVHAGLLLQGEVALQLRQYLLLELAHGALALEQVTHKKKSQPAESEKRDAERPLVPHGMEEHERIHERSQAAGKHQYDDGREDGELQLTAFEVIQLFAV